MSLLSRLFRKKSNDEPALVERAAPPSPTRPIPPPPATPTVPVQPPRHKGQHQPSAAPTSDRMRRLAEEGDRHWIAPGHTFRIQGRSISGGMVYVGESVTAIKGGTIQEPALINPRQALDDKLPDTSGGSLTYWPGYGQLTPGARSAYLTWLQNGRMAGAPIGYVFLFFYGIERRVLIDATRLPAAKAEVPQLLGEVERLLGLYGNNDSFRRYANDFLTVAQVMHLGVNARELAPPMRGGAEIPLSTRVGLGAIVAQGEPIPPIWALSWLRTHPETKLRTPANRCAREFNELFRLRYRAAFGDGLLLERNRAKLSISYRPASGSFPANITATNADLPDVGKLVGPMRKLWEIAEKATVDLEEYSRWVGKNQNRTALTAIALLPSELLPLVTAPAVREFREFLQSALAAKQIAVVSVNDLFHAWPEVGPRPDKRAFTLAARMLETGGIGIEPDPRFTPAFHTDIDRVALFRQRSFESTTSPEYASALALVQLGVLVSSADGAISHSERTALEQLVGHQAGLTDDDRRRLSAYLTLAESRPLKLQHVKAKLEHVLPAQREELRHHLVALVNADGQVSPGEIKLLERIYDLLGFDADMIHAHVHSHATGGRPTSSAAVLNTESSLPFDHDLAAAIVRETTALADSLAQIFFDDEDLPEAAEKSASDARSATGATEALDETLASFLRAAIERNEWSRDELQTVAQNAGLRFLDSAIEAINDAGFALGMDSVIEPDGDELYVDASAGTRLLNER